MKCDNCKNKFRCLEGLAIPFTSWDNWCRGAEIGSIRIGYLCAKDKQDWIVSHKRPDLFCVSLTHDGKKFDGSPSEFADGVLFRNDGGNSDIDWENF